MNDKVPQEVADYILRTRDKPTVGPPDDESLPYAPESEPEPEPEPVQAVPWTCPIHGTDDLLTLTSRKGRVYQCCTAADCEEFERPEVIPSDPDPDPFAASWVVPKAVPKRPVPSSAAPAPAKFWDTLAGSCTLWLLILSIPVLLTVLNLWPIVVGVVVWVAKRARSGVVVEPGSETAGRRTYRINRADSQLFLKRVRATPARRTSAALAAQMLPAPAAARSVQTLVTVRR